MCSLQNVDDVSHYWKQLQKIMLTRGGYPQVPELYMVPRQHVDVERRERGSTDRVPSGVIPHLWAQSLYVICECRKAIFRVHQCVVGNLLMEGLICPAELDPLSRRLSVTDRRPPTEVQGAH